MSTIETLAPPAEIAPEIFAAIVAAVHLTLGASASVTSITFQSEQLIWSLEGRRQIYSSHKVR